MFAASLLYVNHTGLAAPEHLGPPRRSMVYGTRDERNTTRTLHTRRVVFEGRIFVLAV